MRLAPEVFGMLLPIRHLPATDRGRALRGVVEVAMAAIDVLIAAGQADDPDTYRQLESTLTKLRWADLLIADPTDSGSIELLASVAADVDEVWRRA